MIKYKIAPNPNSHTYTVNLSFKPKQNIEFLKLPVWIPGSYMIREFSKHIIKISAFQNQKIIAIDQVSKNTWQLLKLQISQTVNITYEVYAYDNGIRHAYIDHLRGYFNNTSLCLYVAGYEYEKHEIKISDLPKGWDIATGLARIDNKFIANNYYELIDYPFEIGMFVKLGFKVNGCPHSIVLSGLLPKKFSKNKLINDVKKICEKQIGLFGGIAPFSEYVFILNLCGNDIYTGLEHNNSSLLMAPYYSLPQKHHIERTKDYQNLLGLISHEYFHVWNVKRIKPQQFIPYDLENENYTELLWWFEGITSYYDDLILYQAGLITQKEYLQIILNNINNIYKFQGVKEQSLANSSKTAWIKYYRPDENTPNANVSYYNKGALAGLCLDLLIRHQTKGAYSINTLLLALYNKWQYDKQGIQENELPQLIKKYTGCDFSKQLHDFVYTTKELPFKNILAKFGLELFQNRGNYTDKGQVFNKNSEITKKTVSLDLGIKGTKETIGYRITHVYKGGIASLAGLAAGDLLIALDNFKLFDLEKQLNLYVSKDSVLITLFRQDRLINLKLNLQEIAIPIYNIRIVNDIKLSLWL